MTIEEYTLRIPIPRGDLARLEKLQYLPQDTDEAVLILTRRSATLEYWFWGKKPNGTRHTRRTAGMHAFNERGLKGDVRLSDILGEKPDPFVHFGAQQLWPR